MDKYTVWPAVMDVVSHEHDIRGALGDTSGRDAESIAMRGRCC